MGASYIPELNILYDHKRWKVVDLRVKTESPISRSLNPVNRIVLSLAVSLSPALSILALLGRSWAAAGFALAKAAEAGKAVPGAGSQPPRDSGLWEGVERDVLGGLEQRRHKWQQASLQLLKWNFFLAWEITRFINVGFLLLKTDISLLLP